MCVGCWLQGRPSIVDERRMVSFVGPEVGGGHRGESKKSVLEGEELLDGRTV